MIKRIAKDIRTYGPAAIAVIILYFLMHHIWNVFCPMILITGFPCPGCGLTRAMLFAMTGQFVRSFNANPIGLLVLAFVIYIFIMRYLLGRKVKGFTIIFSLLIVAAAGIYVYRMYLFFPNKPPMVYTSGNLLEKHLPYYRELIHTFLDAWRH